MQVLDCYYGEFGVNREKREQLCGERKVFDFILFDLADCLSLFSMMGCDVYILLFYVIPLFRIEIETNQDK